MAAVANPFSFLPGYGFYVDSQYAKCAPTCVKGMTIAVGGGGLSTSVAAPLASWLGKGHMNLSDLKYLTVPIISNVPVAMSQGVAQIGDIVSPFEAPLVANGSIKLVSAIPPGSLLNCFVVGPAGFAHPAAVDAFLRAVSRTMSTYLKPGYLHKAKVVNALASVLNESASQVQGTVAPTFDPTMSLNEAGPKVTVQQTTWLSVGGLLNYTTPLLPSKVVNKSFLAAAIGTP